MYHKRVLWAIKAKNGGLFSRPSANPKATFPAVKPPKFYPADDVKKPLFNKRKPSTSKLRYIYRFICIYKACMYCSRFFFFIWLQLFGSLVYCVVLEKMSRSVGFGCLLIGLLLLASKQFSFQIISICMYLCILNYTQKCKKIFGASRTQIYFLVVYFSINLFIRRFGFMNWEMLASHLNTFFFFF